MSEKANGESATAIQPAASVSAQVNIENDNDLITLYTRVGRLPVQVRRVDVPMAMRESDLVYTVYDVDECEANFLAAYQAVGPVVQSLVNERQRLGYIPDGAEAAANEAWGQAVNTYRTLTLALGANLPTESEVRSWSEHRAATGDTDFTQYPKMFKAAGSIAAVTAWEKESALDAKA